MKINYNASAVVANAALAVNEKKYNVSTERLSTGYKVNHAKENPSGIAIAKRMNAQLKGLSQSKDNPYRQQQEQRQIPTENPFRLK